MANTSNSPGGRNATPGACDMLLARELNQPPKVPRLRAGGLSLCHKNAHLTPSALVRALELPRGRETIPADRGRDNDAALVDSRHLDQSGVELGTPPLAHLQPLDSLRLGTLDACLDVLLAFRGPFRGIFGNATPCSRGPGRRALFAGRQILAARFRQRRLRPRDAPGRAFPRSREGRWSLHG